MFKLRRVIPESVINVLCIIYYENMRVYLLLLGLIISTIIFFRTKSRYADIRTIF